MGQVLQRTNTDDRKCVRECNPYHVRDDHPVPGKMYYGEYYEHWDLYKSAEKDYKAELVKLEATQIPDQEGRGKMANDSEDMATVAV